MDNNRMSIWALLFVYVEDWRFFPSSIRCSPHGLAHMLKAGSRGLQSVFSPWKNSENEKGSKTVADLLPFVGMTRFELATPTSRT